MFPYIPHTKEDIKSMLDTIDISSLDDLFSDISKEIKLNRPLDLEKAMSELEVTNHMNNLFNKNLSVNDFTCFMGAGAYDHYIPSVIKHLTSRSEFYTAYTPYQPEISQGTLQYIFEYQTMISNLTGLDVSNASMYDGATACAEATRMAVESTKRKKILVSETVHPEYRFVLNTYAKFLNYEVITIDQHEGVTDIEKLKLLLNSEASCLVLQYPNFFGIIEDVEEIEKLVHANKSLLIMNSNPIALGILKSPGELGCDIAVGDGQPLGNELNFGGPYLGFLCAKSELLRKMPGRICGETTDVDGKRAFVLTLQAREQHIRREKANSNICSNQSLNALTALIYLTTLGKEGIKEVAMQCTQKAHYAFDQITKSGAFKPLFNKPFFMEFAVTSNLPSHEVTEELLNNKILGGYELEKTYSTLKNSLLFCVTEKRTVAEIDNLISVLGVLK